MNDFFIDRVLPVVMFALVGLFAFAMFMAVYEGTKDRGQCFSSESYTYDQPVQAGSVPMGNGVSMPIYTYIPVTGTRCTRWEFPEGRPRG